MPESRITKGHGPIFIIGCPRSGTTLVHDLLACHENLAWISNLVDRLPRHPELSVLNRVYDTPRVGLPLYLRRTGYRGRRPPGGWQLLPVPREAWTFWATHLARFRWPRDGRAPPRRQRPADLTDREAVRIRALTQALVRYQGRARLLAKYTNLPRMRYLLKAFPDAVFVHVMRDGRATASSHLEKIETRGWRTWEERDWWMRGWPPAWRHEWENRYRSPIAFAAYHWKWNLREIWREAEHVPDDQYLQIHYEDLVGQPGATLARVFAFCGLGRSARTEQYIDRAGLRNMNRKWRRRSRSQQQVLRAILAEPEFRRVMED